MATKWDEEMITVWEEKGKNIFGSILEEAESALKRAEVREADEARVQIMEVCQDKLVALVATVHDETEEKDQDQLNDLGEEVEYNKSNVASIAQMVKGGGQQGEGDFYFRMEQDVVVPPEVGGGPCGPKGGNRVLWILPIP
jgi:vacuolar-type H+-ATPase subunit H